MGPAKTAAVVRFVGTGARENRCGLLIDNGARIDLKPRAADDAQLVTVSAYGHLGTLLTAHGHGGLGPEGHCQAGGPQPYAP